MQTSELISECHDKKNSALGAEVPCSASSRQENVAGGGDRQGRSALRAVIKW